MAGQRLIRPRKVFRLLGALTGVMNAGRDCLFYYGSFSLVNLWWLQGGENDGSSDISKYKNLMNWSAALGYGLGSGSPLSPSFNFYLQLEKSSQFIASFYQHVVVQRRVKNPLVESEVVGITNYTFQIS